LAKIEFIRAIRVILIALGWIIALFMAGTAIALIREYGFEGVGWGWTAFLFTPLILMLAGYFGSAGIAHRDKPRGQPRSAQKTRHWGPHQGG
jgi:hypothetical protein